MEVNRKQYPGCEGHSCFAKNVHSKSNFAVSEFSREVHYLRIAIADNEIKN